MDELSAILDGTAEAPRLPPGLFADDVLLVSRDVIGGKPVLFAWRDQPGEADSGWTLLAGDEPDEWLEDLDRFVERTALDVLADDPSLGGILGAPPDSAYERDRADAPWVELVEE